VVPAGAVPAHVHVDDLRVGVAAHAAAMPDDFGIQNRQQRLFVALIDLAVAIHIPHEEVDGLSPLVAAPGRAADARIEAGVSETIVDHELAMVEALLVHPLHEVEQLVQDPLVDAQVVLVGRLDGDIGIDMVGDMGHEIADAETPHQVTVPLVAMDGIPSLLAQLLSPAGIDPSMGEVARIQVLEGHNLQASDGGIELAVARDGLLLGALIIVEEEGVFAGGAAYEPQQCSHDHPAANELLESGIHTDRNWTEKRMLTSVGAARRCRASAHPTS
jgi:hypothetical protein